MIVFNIFYINYSGKKGWKYLINVKVPKMENVDWFIDKKKIQKQQYYLYMKMQLKKLKGSSIKTEQGQITLKEYYRLENRQFDQIYFTINKSDSIAKIYDLQSDSSQERYKNQIHNYSSNTLETLAACMVGEEIKIKKKQYGIIVLTQISQGNSLEDKNLKLSNQQLVKLTLFLVRSASQLKKKNLTFSNFRPENIFLSTQTSFFLINSQFLSVTEERSEINQFFWEIVEKDFSYWSPQVLDNYSNNKINFASDLFSIGCILYTIKYGKYPFQSRFATINYAYPQQNDEEEIGLFISKFLSNYENRCSIDLEEIEKKLKKLAECESVKQNQKVAQSYKKTNVNNNSFLNDLSNVFSKWKSDSEGWFLNYVQDDDKEPLQKYADHIITKIYIKEEKANRINSIIQKFIESNNSKENSVKKVLLLIGNILRKGPCHVYSCFFGILKNVILIFRNTQSVQHLASLILQKTKLHEKTKKCLSGNYYLQEITKFKALQISDLKEMVSYLQKCIAFLKKKITEPHSHLNNTIITFFCDETYFLVSMIIFFIISIRKDNDLQLRNDPLQQLIPLEKVLNTCLRKISDISNFVGAHAIYSLQTQFISYQEEISLSQNPYYTSLQHFYRSCRCYKGLSIPENYSKVFCKDEKKEKSEKNIEQNKVQKKLQKPGKVYFIQNQIDSDQQFEYKEQKKSAEAPATSKKTFEQFGYKIKRSESGKDHKKKKVTENGRDSDNNSRNSKNESIKSKKTEKEIISFEEFGNVKKEESKNSSISNEFNFFNELNSKPKSTVQNDIKERKKNIPPKPPKQNNGGGFQDFNKIFFKQNKEQKPKELKQLKPKEIQNKKQTEIFVNQNPFKKDIWNINIDDEIDSLKINPKVQEILKGLRLKELKDLLRKNDNLIIDFNSLVFLKVIGSGSAGDVYLGTYKNQQIAIKKVKAKQNPNALKEFERQLVTYIKIKKNPYLVSLIGLSQDKGDFYLLTEFCESGCLFDLLHKKVKDIPITWKQKLQFALEIAEGMKCLHQMKPTIIHRDLKSLNVFVTKQQGKWKMKVADFGLSRSPEAEMMTTQLGTIHWMAPQLLEGKQYSVKVDVYSYGILIWEILVRKTPYSNLNTPMAILKYVAMDKKRPSLELVDRECPKELIYVMEKCWVHEPSKRPDFRQIIVKLREIREKVFE